MGGLYYVGIARHEDTVMTEIYSFLSPEVAYCDYCGIEIEEGKSYLADCGYKSCSACQIKIANGELKPKHLTE